MASNQTAAEQKEQQAVNYIRAHADLTDSVVVEKLYEQLVSSNTFRTSVGLAFLEELEQLQSGETAVQTSSMEVMEPTIKTYTKTEVLAELRKVKAIQERKVQLLTVSTVILGIMVIVMLAISMTSKLPTIVNYKDMVTDEYASWEQELTNREQEVRRREQELLEKESQYVESMDQQRNAGVTYDTTNMDALEDETTEDVFDETSDETEDIDNGETQSTSGR